MTEAIPSGTDELFNHAKDLIPGGVNSPVRAFGAVGGTPRFITKASGSRIVDESGREYIDYIGSWGPMILGHCHPDVVKAVQEQAATGMSYGAPTRAEVEMAELLVERVPCLEMVRLVSSGTEATMSVIRVARGATGRDMIIKFEGNYHGHGDSFLSKAGSGAATFGVPTSPGVPKGAASATLNARYNDLQSVRSLFASRPDEIAAVIVEPVCGNMGCVKPKEGFLAGLLEICEENGALLIFDEVMTGFRVAPGGAQDLFGVTPHLTTLGKIVGGGLPVGAYGGRRDVMSHVSPAGPVYQAGTLSGNPLAVAAGMVTLRYLQSHPEIYRELEGKCARLEKVVTGHIQQKGYPVSYGRVGSMATVFFHPGPLQSWDDVKDCDTERFGRYFWSLIEDGIHMPPSQYEAFFTSIAHSDEEIEQTARAMCRALDKACA